MLMERNMLEDKMLVALSSLSSKQVELLQRVCLKHNMTPAKISDIIDHRLPIQEIGDGELFWIFSALKNVLECRNLPSIDRCFTPLEISSYSKSKLPDLKVKKFPVVFKNVQRIRSNQWQTVMSIDELMDLKQRQAIFYNPNTQRPLIVIEKGERIVTKVDLNQKSVKEMMTLMEQGVYNPHHITINLNKDKDTEPIFKGNDLIVQEGELDIIDGYHNYIAATRMKAKNKDFEYYMPIIITHFNERQAGMYISQENKKNIINTSYTASLDITNVGNIITERINDNTDFYLYNKIGKQSYSNIKFSDVANAINYYYGKTKQGAETARVSREICKYWNDIIEIDAAWQDKKYTFNDVLIIIACLKYEIAANDCIVALNSSEQLQNMQPPMKKTFDTKIKKFLGECLNVQ